MTIILVALLHIIPLLVCRVLTDSRPIMLTVAAISATLGSMYGSPAYTALDIAAVLLGLYWLWPPDPETRNTSTGQRPKELRSAPQGIRSEYAPAPPSRARPVDLTPRKPFNWSRLFGFTLLLGVLLLMFSYF